MTCSGHTMIIDSDELAREGLRRIVAAHFQVAWCSGAPATEPVPGCDGNASPLVIISKRGQEAIADIRQVRQQHASAKIILLVDASWRQEEVSLLRRFGVHSVIRRTSSCAAFVSTLMLVDQGMTVMPREFARRTAGESPQPAQHDPTIAPIARVDEVLLPEIAAAISNEQSESAGGACRVGGLGQDQQLSLRERGVLGGVCAGLSNKEIARSLGITEATVKVHVKAILRKARLRNRTQAAIWASRDTSEVRYA